MSLKDEQRLESLIACLRKQGFKCLRDIRLNESMPRGLELKEDVQVKHIKNLDFRRLQLMYNARQARQKLFEVPSSALVNVRTVRKLYARHFCDKLSAIQLLSYHVASLRFCNTFTEPTSSSNSTCYAQSLPSAFETHPLWWTNRQADALGSLLNDAPPSFKTRCEYNESQLSQDWDIVKRVQVRSSNFQIFDDLT